MTSGQADDLATAYDMACRAHPKVLRQSRKAEKEAADKSAAAARSQAAAKAKAASVRARNAIREWLQQAAGNTSRGARGCMGWPAQLSPSRSSRRWHRPIFRKS